MAWIEVPARPSRRRAVVFIAAFLVAAAASLTYTFMRPAEYRAVARLQISPAATASPDTRVAAPQTSEPSAASSFLTEVQVLTSRPLLTDVVERLRSQGMVSHTDGDPVDAAQRMLHAEPVSGTRVVILSAQGTERDLLPRLVNEVTDVYRQRVLESYKDVSTNTYTALEDEVGALARDVAAKRQTVDAFRKRYDIVSMERTENQVLAKLNGLNAAYNDAKAKLVTAEAQYELVRKAASAGQVVLSAKDDPTLADLEQRASKLREQLRELSRKYTADYLDLDPDVKLMRARLADLEKQLSERRASSQQAALASAQQALSSARSAVDQLRRDVGENQREAQEFASHLNEYKALQDDLTHAELAHREALDRLTKLQASSRERAPHVEILEAAAPIEAPWRPDYRTDAIVSVAGSLVFGLIAVLFGEFIAGPASAPGMTVRHSWEPAGLGREMPPPMPLAAPRMVELPAPEPVPRELEEIEIADLVAAAGDDARLACVALLMGLSADELVALRCQDIDLEQSVIRVAGDSARAFPLDEPLRSLVAARCAEPRSAEPLLHDAQGRPLRADDLAHMVLYAAYDAALERPQEITPEVLRFTYLAFLLRQGIRMGDIVRIAGRIPQAELAGYMQLAASTARRPLEQIERILPPLRSLAGSAHG